MVKTALSAAKRSWIIHCQRNCLPGIFVVPVNPRRLDVVSTDTRVCYFVRLSYFLFIMREQQVLLILFQREPSSFIIVNVSVINKGEMKETCNIKVMPNFLYQEMGSNKIL
jgi:hypothetical protein